MNMGSEIFLEYGFKTVLVLLLLSGILLITWKNFLWRKTAIPVCRGVPLLGFLYIFYHKFNYQTKLADMKRKYGKLCYVKLGSHWCLWLNDYKLIKEAWNSPIFCGRPQLPGIKSRTHGFVGGIIFNDGKDFTEQRRFAVKHLKENGLGKVSMEQIIMHEVKEIISEIGTANGKPISTCHLFNIASLNILWKIVTGERYSHNDEPLLTLLEILKRNMELQGGSMLAVFIPWIAKIFPNISGWNSYLKDARQIFDYWLQYSNQRIENFIDEESRTPNFVDAYIQQMKKCSDPESSFYGDKGVLSLAATLQDLFIAGSETSSITLSWIFLYLAAFPNNQLEVFNEIQFAIGTDSPSPVHRKRMPITEAFIYETMRHLTLAPLGMIHCSIENTILDGFHIPKGTLVHANLACAHHDPSAWQEPHEFNPHRFLSDDGTSVIKREPFLAFSKGKRGCPGEALAINELFLFVVSLVQKYAIEAGSKLDLTPTMGVSATPKPHKLIFVKRC